MKGTVVIDCFAESVGRYRSGHAIVAVDVVRATTTAITAVAGGRRCFTVPTIEAALKLSERLENALLVGEQNGIMPTGFDLNNSPAELLRRQDIERPAILLSSSGTRLCHEASSCEAAFLGCLRNYSSVAAHLAGKFREVAIVGAGSRGAFREEDQLCCAWIAEKLMSLGYLPKDARTLDIIRQWQGKPADVWLGNESASYLRSSGQVADLDFIIQHIDDLSAPFALRNDEVIVDSADAELREQSTD
jgi:2-phosphosulfolactate phosphatase